MKQNITFIFLYLFTLLFSLSYSLDLNISKKNVKFDVNCNTDIMVKKKELKLSWKAPDFKAGRTTFKIELLDNPNYKRNNLVCNDLILVANNVTTEEYIWITPKLKKNNIYGILITVNGSKVYGLSEKLKYIGKSGDFYDYFTKNGPINNDKKSYIQITAMIIAALVFISAILALISYKLYKDNKKTQENVREILETTKGKKLDSTKGSIPEYPEFEIKSEAESEIVREELKREALEHERKKLMESMKDRLNAEGFQSLSPSTTPSSEVGSNAVSNTNTDFSWHGMEVMTFNSPLKPNNSSGNVRGLSPLSPLTPLHAPKKIDYNEIALEVEKLEEEKEKEEEEREKLKKEINVEPVSPVKEKKVEIVQNTPNSTVKFKL